MTKPLPPTPDGWNKTIGDLFDELKRGERTSVGFPEEEWARAFEREGISALGMRFPRRGDVYEALEDMTVGYLSYWRAPFTGGGDGTLRKGDLVTIDHEFDSRPVGVYATPLEYDTLEARMIPASDRSDPKYAGFRLSLRTVDLNRRFRLIHEDGG